MKIKLLSSIFGVVIIALYFFLLSEKPYSSNSMTTLDQPINKESTTLINTNSIVSEYIKPKGLYNPDDTNIITKEYEVLGNIMEPIIMNNEKVDLQFNYYNIPENIIANGDIVVYENPYSLHTYTLKVTLKQGDFVNINKISGTIKVNGNTLKNSSGSIYKFEENELKWFEIYTKNGIIKDDVYFLLAENIESKQDSRSFGPVIKEGILGKVIIQ